MSEKRPNFLVIVADDLGYSDVGCYGSEIKTPNIDRLARDGAQFLDFYSSAMCSPTRAMILSGTDPHVAGLGCMAESRRAQFPRWNVPGHEGHLNMDVVALPELLHDHSYHTLMSGKWHLGTRPDTNPAARGFDRSFALIPGCSNHFGYEPYLKDYESIYQQKPPVLYTQDGKYVDVIPNTSNSYTEGFYSTEDYTSNLLNYLDEHRRSVDRDKPFFAYLAYAAPHWPLQCSEEDRAMYRGMYDSGPEALRSRRLSNLQAQGIIDEQVAPHDMMDFGRKRWPEMTDDERARSARAMEVYAGMVTCLDRNVGRIIDDLEKNNEMDNTFILFMSDNGAAGAWIESQGAMGRASLRKVIETDYDNSLENMGNHNSFFSYGPFWAQAATAPSRLCKSFTTEGGIRVPCIVRYPPLTGTFTSEGNLVRAFASATDIMPTILDLAQIPHPAAGCASRERAAYGNRMVRRMTGKSWTNYFRATPRPKGEAGIYGDDWWYGWELHGLAGLRKGRFKIVWLPSDKPTGTGQWQLYALDQDPGETVDLALSMPDTLKELTQLFEEYVAETGTIWGPMLSKTPKDKSWQLPEDAIGGNPETGMAIWHHDSSLRGPPVTELKAKRQD